MRRYRLLSAACFSAEKRWVSAATMGETQHFGLASTHRARLSMTGGRTSPELREPPFLTTANFIDPELGYNFINRAMHARVKEKVDQCGPQFSGPGCSVAASSSFPPALSPRRSS
jgi:hypothetical protein